MKLLYGIISKKYYTIAEAMRLAKHNELISDFRSESARFYSHSSKEQNEVLLKIVHYKSELDRIDAELKFWDGYVPETDNWSSFYVYYRSQEISRYNRRRSLVEQLIAKGLDLLSVGDSPLLAYQFRNLEAEIKWMDVRLDESPAYQFMSISEAKENLRDEIKTRQRKHLKTLRRIVRTLIRSILNKIAIDRRAHFRSIVHFIFKNLDDYDGKKYALQLL